MYYDPHCFFYYVNRLKEIIKFNGIQVKSKNSMEKALVKP